MRLLFFCGLVGFYVYQLVLSSSGLLRYFQIHDRIDQKSSDVTLLERRNAFLKQQIHLLKRDPLSIEYAIREAYGYVKPNEIVVEIKPAKN